MGRSFVTDPDGTIEPVEGVKGRVAQSKDLVATTTEDLKQYHRWLNDYLASLRRLEPLIDEVDLLLPSHNRVPLDPPIIREMIAGFEQLIAGQAPIDDRTDSLGRRTRQANFGRFSVLLPA